MAKSTATTRIASLVTLLAILIIAVILLSNQIFETNRAGYYQVKQAFITGKMSVKNTPGLYGRFFGEIFTYQISDINYFSKHEEDGGAGVESAPINVRFNDGGTAEISGSIKYKLSQKVENQLELHEDFKGYEAVKQDLVRQVITEALMQTATLMKAEESYSTRRSEFTAMAEAQIKEGIFETYYEEVQKDDAEGNEFIERYVYIQKDSTGKPKIRKQSPFSRYDIEIIQFVIKDIDFDETIDALIAKKKEAEQQRVVARANAERAKQDAITASEEGKARIAEAEANELVKKITAVTEAQKEFEVAEFQKKKANEEAEARLIRGRADAEANRLLVSAGLTPIEKATIEKETRIGVAAEMAKVKFPQMMIIGGNDQNNLNPFDAVGLESFLKIQKSLADSSK